MQDSYNYAGQLLDQFSPDPDEKYKKNINVVISLSHGGKLQIHLPL